MVEHVSIPDGEIHEPKGITSAFEGQAYIADGQNSGSWQNIVPSLGGAVFIASANDFPTPVGGVSTLLPQAYVISSGLVIDLDFSLKFVDSRTALIGMDKSTAFINFTSNVPVAGIINDTGVNVTLLNLTLASNSVPLFACSGNGIATFSLNNSLVSNNTGQSIGELTEFIAVNFEEVENSPLSTGSILFKGVNGSINIEESISFSPGAVWLDFTDATFSASTVSLEGCSHSLLTGVSKFADIDPTKVFGGAVDKCFFVGSTAPLGAIGADTANFIITDTLGVSDTKKAAISNLVPPETVSIAAVGNPVPIEGTWSLTSGSQFSQGVGSNSLIFDGINFNDDETFLISTHLSCTKSGGGGAKLYTFRILKNGSPIAGGEGTVDVSDRGGSIFLRAFDNCQTGDEYSIDVQNTENSDDFTVNTADMTILRTN